jgi:endo-1,4-beta-D-glucanase Y
MTASNRKLSGLLSSITLILEEVQGRLEGYFANVEVCDTRVQCVNLRVTTSEGRTFGFRLALCAQNTTKMLRQFVRRSIRQHRTQEIATQTAHTSFSRDEVRVFIQIARSSRNDFDRLIGRISTAIKDVIRRWRNFGPCNVAGVHVRGGCAGSAYDRIDNLLQMAGITPMPLSAQT